MISGSQTLTMTEAAALIGISRQSAHQAIKTGRLKATWEHRRWWVSRDDALRYQGARQARPRRGRL